MRAHRFGFLSNKNQHLCWVLLLICLTFQYIFVRAMIEQWTHLELSFFTDAERALRLLEQYHSKLGSPQDIALSNALARVIKLFQSKLFYALIGKFDDDDDIDSWKTYLLLLIYIHNSYAPEEAKLIESVALTTIQELRAITDHINYVLTCILFDLLSPRNSKAWLNAMVSCERPQI